MRNRKPASSPAKVPADVREALSLGEIESLTLAEGLAVDFDTLLRTISPAAADAARHAGLTPTLGIVRRMALAADALLAAEGTDVIPTLCAHRSDTVRGWAAYALADQPFARISERIATAQPLADDTHFGVREWVWLAFRPAFMAHTDESLAALASWTTLPSPNLRRFASEATRPRGVWCAHWPELKAEPRRGLPLLEPLRADPSRYVQDSVANWLNDAGKSDPRFVQDTTDRWERDSSCPASAYIVRRARRSLA